MLSNITSETPVLVLGGGKMGGALIEGWIAKGVSPDAICVLDPKPSDALRAMGVQVNPSLPTQPAAVFLAVKPQIMAEALPQLATIERGTTVFVSVAAGLTLDWLRDRLGKTAEIVRTIPNTPAAIGQGVTAMIGTSNATPARLDLVQALMEAVGSVVRLDHEKQMDAVTALSGSGPAYVFHMIEALAAAGQAQGLPPQIALDLARATVAGAGALAATGTASPQELRCNVTSPNGTTQAGLEVLMDERAGLTDLMTRVIAAAAKRSRELANG